ncbi:hypothetical protein GCM10010967_15010 [Dyadobacter beijingensis]|uniref:Bacteriocin-type signal sequence-containing protein n=1 Tax=Dyadobacter beijingensis TaxID=365489 RepID=A0ABQ2HNY9_9BACT|nr:hypothetical protein [Dyadobacter beijingensis]GGM84187.1 hypothetical protein GCM10010967_15010 [Dyadobacter beijingensis]
MKDKNQNLPEESKIKSIEIAKERLAELDDDQLEKLSGGANDNEQTTMSACSCQTVCQTI